MVRPLRIEFEGALYHLCVRGNERQKVFRDEDRLREIHGDVDGVGELWDKPA